MMHQDATTDKQRQERFHRPRNLELARQVSLLPDAALVGPEEVAALTGVATTSFRRPGQREKMGVPAPIYLGRHLTWRLGDIRAWLAGGHGTPASATPAPARRPGRPTKAEAVARAQAQGQQ